MRLTLITVTAIGLLISCNSIDTTKIKTERKLLIEELKRLQTVFASKNKEKITDIFQFPLSDTTVGIYIDDSVFNAQLKKNGNMTTRSMFVLFFPQISESLQIDELNQLFKKLKPDSLLQKDNLEYEAFIKTEPCYHFYTIKIEKELITLTVGTNSNKDYKSKSVSENEIPENSSEICEHALWWVFTFDGKRLHFKGISGAG